jgi:hypothetical protein
MATNLVDQLVDIATEIESTDPIDWGLLAVSEEDSYRLIATSVLEAYLGDEPESRDLLLLATCVKLSVENFALNLKLLRKGMENE